MGYPSAEDFSRSQWLTPLDASTRKATGAASVELGPMVAGAVYFLRSDANAFYMQGATGVSVTTTTGYPIFAQEAVRVYCDNATTNGFVAIITSGAVGTAWLEKVS